MKPVTKQLREQLRVIDRELRRAPLAPQPTGFRASYPDNVSYLENQWAEDTFVAFEQQHGDEGENIQNLAGILCHFARWCDANGLQLSEALKLAATRYSEETHERGQLSAL